MLGMLRGSKKEKNCKPYTFAQKIKRKIMTLIKSLRPKKKENCRFANRTRKNK